MFAVATDFTMIAPSVTLTHFGWVAWYSFFSSVKYGHMTSAVYREEGDKGGPMHKVSWSPKDGFEFQAY